jgi:pimeloyl-ACP methyl ester carboxylesterase
VSPSQLRFRRIGRLLIGLVVLYLVGWASWNAALRFFPLESSAASAKLELWRGGVRPERRAGLSAWERDFCGRARFCECIVLVHGLGDQALTWKRLLLQPQTAWTRSVHLIAVDLPGSGDSPAPQDLSEYRVRRVAAQLDLAAQEVRGCSRKTWVGNSLGGWISAWVAIDHPKAVQRLVLASSAGLESQLESASADLLGQPSEESLKEFQRRAYAHPHPLPEFVWRAIARRASHGNSRQVLEAQRPEDRLDHELGRVHVPTLVFWGKEDRVIPPDAGRRFQRGIAGSVLREIPECGHLPQKECPQALIQAIDAILGYGAM